MGRKKIELYEAECWVTVMVGIKNNSKLVLPDTMGYSKSETEQKYEAKYGSLFGSLRGTGAGIVPNHCKATLTIKI